MKLLLDTHIWLWSLLDPKRLSRYVTRLLRDPANEIWLSPISTWELTILVKKGRIILDQPVESWVKKAITAAPLKEAPVTHEIALETLRVELPHNDPADRLITATARVLHLVLVTADKNLIGAEGFKVIPNR
jgi:PIN domain nuclease of toxin-antitoxin system